MVYEIKGYYLVLLILFSSHSHSNEPLVLVTSLEKPPYVIPSQDSGFEVELIRAVLAKLDYDISLLYVPYGRSYQVMQQVKADIGLSFSERNGISDKILTIPYITYQDVAVSLRKKSIKLKQVQELLHYSVVTFQEAHKVLGTEFSNIAKMNPLYLELPDQRRQVELLVADRVEVVVMDINIFKYFAKSIIGSNQNTLFDVHNIFPSIQYRAAITDPTLRQAFNRAFTQYSHSVEYKKLHMKYDMTHIPH